MRDGWPPRRCSIWRRRMRRRHECASQPTVLITGAAGFLGRACCAAFTLAGFQVRALVRNPAASTDLQPVSQGGIFRCDLPDAIDERALEGEPRALVHCAYETRSEE